MYSALATNRKYLYISIELYEVYHYLSNCIYDGLIRIWSWYLCSKVLFIHSISDVPFPSQYFDGCVLIFARVGPLLSNALP